jgi:hypothetical protein
MKQWTRAMYVVAAIVAVCIVVQAVRRGSWSPIEAGAWSPAVIVAIMSASGGGRCRWPGRWSGRWRARDGR